MNTIKTVLVTVVTVLLLQLIPAYPALSGVILYITLNWGIVFLSSEADPKTSFNKEINLASRDGELVVFVFLVTLAGFLFWIFCTFINHGFKNEFYNIYKYIFKSEPPTIKFQSPILIQKAVDPESDVG